MTRLGRDQGWSSVHERARTRAGERLWEVLDAGEAEWLDRHLTECGDCRAVADSYEAQRQELRALRDRQPVPPRDLWARTAAAIEREDARRRPSLRPDPAQRSPIPRRRRPSPVPLGALSGLLVVAVVVGVALLGGRTPPLVPSNPSQTPPLVAQTNAPIRTIAPAGTPIVVAAGEVGWLTFGPDGQIDVFSSDIDEVCADAEGPDCAPIEGTPRSGEPVDSVPQAVVKSPNDKQLVLVQGQTTAGPGKVVVVPVPTAPGSSPDPTPTVTVTPAPPATTPPPSLTPTPPVETPSLPPAVTADPNETPAVTPPASPLVTPSPTAPGGPIEIASDVIVVGQAAAYSPDGAWFAFSARPSDGSHGPDIYVWRVGDPQAAPITTDHRSVFSGWLDGRVLGSRAVVESIAPVGSAAPSATTSTPASPDASASPDATASTPPAAMELRPEAFLLDPATGVETVLDAAPFWRPSVGPSGTTAIYWEGTVTLADNGYDWRPATGRLVVGPWPPVPAESEPSSSAPPASEQPASAAPASDAPSGSASPSPAPTAPTQVIDETAIRDWDARWDETGSHVAIWIADEADPTIGRLSHYVFNPAAGTLKVDPKLSSQQALPGFSIGNGRIAWATPPGQDGKGSHVEVLAWTRDARDASGKVGSAPGEDQVVVIR